MGILSPNSAGWVEISVCKFQFFGNVIEKSFPTSIEYIDLVQATVESTLPEASIKNSIPSLLGKLKNSVHKMKGGTSMIRPLLLSNFIFCNLKGINVGRLQVTTSTSAGRAWG